MDMVTTAPEGLTPVVDDTTLDGACEYYKCESEDLTDEQLNNYIDLQEWKARGEL